MPLVSEFHCIGVPLCTQPWKIGIGKPERAACQGFEFRLQHIEKLIKNRMNAIVSGPGRGGETGRLQIQLLDFLDEPSQMAFTVVLKRRPMPVGAVVWPIWILGNPILTYQFISEPGQMQIDAGIRIALAGVRGQFNPTFDQPLQSFAPKHLMDELSHILRFTLSKMLGQVVLLECFKQVSLHSVFEAWAPEFEKQHVVSFWELDFLVFVVLSHHISS